MGNRLAPPFTIIFMLHNLKTRILETSSNHPSLWVRYIDDMFGVWQHWLTSLEEFHHFVNHEHPTISFSLDHSSDSPSIPLLDVSICIAQDRSIQTELCVKPTHSGILLNYNLVHPQSIGWLNSFLNCFVCSHAFNLADFMVTDRHTHTHGHTHTHKQTERLL